jgi:hypothetical protein
MPAGRLLRKVPTLLFGIDAACFGHGNSRATVVTLVLPGADDARRALGSLQA